MLIAQLVGHIIALPALYLVLNFTSLVLETILSEVLRTFTFGMVSGQGPLARLALPGLLRPAPEPLRL